MNSGMKSRGEKMKYIIIIGDGMADNIKACPGGKTPMMAAKKPVMDMLAKKGRTGMLVTIPEDMPAGSSVANLGILGYEQHKCYQGRGVLEAASMGVDIKPEEVAMRCNIICIQDEKIKTHSAGHISTEDGTTLIQYIDKKLGDENIKFYPGVSYRHLLVLKDATTDILLTPPHDELGTAVKEVMPKAKNDKGTKTAELIDSLIRKSWELLKDHPINKERIKQGKDPANSIWPWSPGYKPEMQTLKDRFGINGAVISAVDLINGLGVYAGLDVIKVKGATGLYDTNYEGKADAAIEALKNHDFVYVHVEASDEAGHEGDYDLKKKTIEYLDKRLIQRILDNLDKINEKVRIAVLPDHPTPIDIKTHTRNPVPFLIYDIGDKGEGADKVEKLDETNPKEGGYGLLKGDEFIRVFFRK